MAYLYYRTVTIDQTKVPGDLVNFSVLVSVTNASLKTTANGGKVENASGFDIIFSSSNNLDGSDKIPHEIESYNAVTGAIEFWTKVAAVSGSIDTVFYILYGNSAIVSSQEDVANTWDSDFLGVYHLKTFVDPYPTSNGDTDANLTLVSGANPSNEVGQINGGSNVVANYYQSADLGFTLVTPLTMSCWVKPDTAGLQTLLKHTPTGGGNEGRRLGLYNGGAGNVVRPFYSRDGSGSGTDFTTLDFDVTADVWIYISFKLDTAGTASKAFMGDAGTLTSETGAESATITGTPVKLAAFGRDAAPNDTYDGGVDEIRFSKVDRSDNWITTEYNNQYDPATFLALGSEVTSVLTITANDALSLIDTSLIEAGIVLEISDAISLTDEENVDGPDPAIVQTDAIALSDAVTVVAALLLDPFGDTISLSDAVALIQTLAITFTDTVTLSDAVSINANGGISVGDPLLLTDEVKFLLAVFMTFSDTLNLSDEALIAIIQEIQASDSLSLSDAVTVSMGILGLTFDDALALTDAASVSLDNAAIPPPVNYNDYYRRYLNDVRQS